MADEPIEERDRALYKILINEGYSHADAILLIAEADRSKLDEIFAKLRADPRRERDVKIMTPDEMSPGVIDLNAAKIRAETERFHKEMQLEKAQERRFREQMTALMRASEMTSYLLIVGTLRALLEVLIEEGTDLDENKKSVEEILNAF